MATYYIDSAGNDSNAGTSAGSGNSWLTLGKAASTVAAGDKVWAKNDQTYSETLTLATSGTADNEIVWEGYTTTTGDGGRCVVEGGNTRATCLALAATARNVFVNFTFQGATGQIFGWTGAAEVDLSNCRILKGSGTAPVSMQATSGFSNLRLSLLGCEVANFAGAGVRNMTADRIVRCEIHDNGGHGIAGIAFAACGSIRDSLIYSNGGDGINIPSSTDTRHTEISGNTIHGNTGDGIDLGAAVNRLLLADNVITANGGYGINPAAPSGATIVFTAKNFFRSNTSGEINTSGRVVAVRADVTLSADPYTNAGSDDYSLNTTSGGGAAVRAARAYQSFPGGTTTGYADGGAVQHQDAGGGSSGGWGVSAPEGRGQMIMGCFG